MRQLFEILKQIPTHLSKGMGHAKTQRAEINKSKNPICR